MLISNRSLPTALVLTSSCLVASCSSLSFNDTQAQCEGDATYRMTYQSVWSEQNFPVDYPSANAHYSKFVGATHRSDETLWRLGARASEAVKLVAEKGQNFKLEQRVQWWIEIDKAGAYIDGPDIGTGSGSAELTFTATPEFSSVTLLSMIAPTPDWIVGVSALNLCVNGAWRSGYEEALIALDAGTDSGVNYAYATEATETTPPEGIQPVVNARFGIGPDTPFGTLALERVN